MRTSFNTGRGSNGSGRKAVSDQNYTHSVRMPTTRNVGKLQIALHIGTSTRSPDSAVSYCSTAARKRANTCNKFVQELIRVHKHGKVSAADRYKFFLRRLDQCEVLPGKGGRGREVLGSFKEEYWDCKFQSKVLKGRRRCLRD